MKIKRLILVGILIKIICLTLKSDSCNKDEPGLNFDKIIGHVQKEFCVNRTSISMYDLNSSEGQTRNICSTHSTSNSGTKTLQLLF
jgi:hypothetical protein